MRAALLFVGLMFWMPSAFAVMHHIEIVSPRAGQQGTVVEVTLEGGFMKEAREIIFFRPGIKCTEVKVLLSLKERRVMFAHGGFIEDKVLCKFEIAPDCPLGLHPFKVRTATELSTLSTFEVSAFPCVDEGEDHQGVNDTLKTAKVIPINTTVRGRITSSNVPDIDLYRVAGKAGSHLSVEVDSVRIAEKHYGDSEFDLMVRLLDADGKEIAKNDDSALHVQDPIVSAVLPKDGDYFVEIKQRLFSSGGWTYVAHIGNNKRPLAVFPAGGPAGETAAGDAARRSGG